ncbi:3,4-dihydroxy-2-butanone-4-phosphate synthase [bacterium SCSIO 12643]|nr:3,4-dihydroxy-2-butanone-4-phosphate synthase [bacterium SCSIO 12643]
MSTPLNTIEEAIEDIKKGKVVIVVDDENRENEGDFVAAAELVTPEMINYMATYGRGLICTPVTEDRAKRAGLELMVGNTSDPQETAFTVSIDLLGDGNTTGISAADRANTIKALLDDHPEKKRFGKPGHVFPLIAKNGGVLRRTGHTEAAIDLARLAGLEPAGVIVEIMNEDGTMARLPQLKVLAEKLDLKLVSIEDLIAYRMENESLIERMFEVTETVGKHEYKLITYEQTTTGEKHIALTLGEFDPNVPTLVRVHSSYVQGNVFDSLNCKTGPQIHAAMRQIEKEGRGAILYMQHGHSSTPSNGITASGIDSVIAKMNSPVKIDSRDYGIGAQILRDLGISKMKVMSSRSTKRTGIVGYGLEVAEYVPLELA